LRKEVAALKQDIAEKYCCKIEANQRIANAQAEAAANYSPVVPVDLKAIRERAEKASSGISLDVRSSYQEDADNANFVAHARADIFSLLARVAAAEAEIKELTEDNAGYDSAIDDQEAQITALNLQLESLSRHAAGLEDTWTDKLPDREGWWWYRDAEVPWAYPRRVEGGRNKLVSRDGSSIFRALNWYRGEWSSSPISEPIPPTRHAGARSLNDERH
jgi:hypothetical protein